MTFLNDHPGTQKILAVLCAWWQEVWFVWTRILFEIVPLLQIIYSDEHKVQVETNESRISSLFNSFDVRWKADMKMKHKSTLFPNGLHLYTDIFQGYDDSSIYLRVCCLLCSITIRNRDKRDSWRSRVPILFLI